MARGAKIKSERRRRDGISLSGYRDRLHVDEQLLDRENFSYRWINDEPGRVYQMTQQDDWDIVSDRDSDSGMGSETANQVGSGAEGSPLRAILVRKPKEYFDEDKNKKQRHIDEAESAMQSSGDNPGVTPGAKQDGQYQPRSQTVISRG